MESSVNIKRRASAHMRCTLILRASVLALTAIVATGTAASEGTPLGNASSDAAVVDQVSPPKLRETIDLRASGTPLFAVAKMTFSPDSRYLAIVGSPELLKTDIVVWDLQLGRVQSRIHCQFDYAAMTGDDLLWSHDGSVISFGAVRQWNPINGEALPDNPAIGGRARLNVDGSKMLTIVGTIAEPSYIHVYDTRTWAVQKLYVDGLRVQSAAWTADDRILVGATITKEAYGNTMDGYAIAHWEDTALRLLDPSGSQPTKAVWFPAKPTDNPKFPFNYSFPIGSKMRSNFATNQIFLDAGFVVEANTLNFHRYHSFDKDDIAPGAFGMSFSSDGRLLYLKGASFSHGGHAPIKNSIVDLGAGKPLVQFDGAMDHQGNLAVSPDGKLLALGDGHSVLVFSLR